MARDYGKVLARFWNGDTGRRLRGDHSAQLVALYLITGCQSNMIGLYPLPLPLLSHETGVPLSEVESALARLTEEGFCRYDRESETIWVIEAARIQIGDTIKKEDKVAIFVARQADEMRNSPFHKDFVKRYGRAFNIAPSKGLRSPSRGPSQAPPKELRSQEQDPDLSRSRDRSRAGAGGGARGGGEQALPPSAPAGEDAGSIPGATATPPPHVDLEVVSGNREEPDATPTPGSRESLVGLLAGVKGTPPEKTYPRRWQKHAGLTRIGEEVPTLSPADEEASRARLERQKAEILNAALDRLATIREDLDFEPPPSEGAESAALTPAGGASKP
jgi:hypothetical protein